MGLAPGTRLGPYEIVALLGAGGMGEVYRATDSKLARDVAIKILPELVATDLEPRARFEREARALAALNHPNIAHIHGFEDSTGTPALVMELVEGPTLADRIARGPIPIDDALSIAKQIAHALDAAHEKGVIHRDLKPANIKVTPDGTVKVLDFGLAKMLKTEPTIASMTVLSTLSAQGTVAGTILGTPAYMSPEQARGTPVEKRTDIWSFACVLYEMLTGRLAFGGATISDHIAAILERDPDWSALPAATPMYVRRLLRRCLEKDPGRRLHDIADARIELDDTSASPDDALTSSQTPLTPRFASTALAVIGTTIVSAVVTWGLTRPRTAVPATVTRFTLTPSSALPLLGDVRVAPDGSFLVYSSGGRLAIRRFDRLEASPIPGLTNATRPFVSPDSRWVGYVENFTLKKVAVTGGSSITLAQLPGLPLGASWIDDTTLIVATNNGTTGLLRVTVGGGEPTVLTTVDRARGERGHSLPFVLPGGRAVLFTIAADQPVNAQVAMLDLQTGQRTTLVRGGSDARYVSSGHLVFATAGGLSAVRFDLTRRAVVGDPVEILDGVAREDVRANASVTDAGTLVYLAGEPQSSGGRSLVWVDRQGRETSIPLPPRAYVGPRLSPDGTRVVVEIRDQENDIWMWDRARQTLTRLTFDPAIDRDPVWTPDGQRIIFASSRTGAFDLYARAADGTGSDVRLTASTNAQYALAVTPDGAFVIGNEVRPRTSFDIVRFALGVSGARSVGMSGSETLIDTPFDERNGEVSPDGRFLAYQSNESGRYEVYVRPYPQPGSGRWQVSTNGGTVPAWAHGGRELFYMDRANHLMVVPINTMGATFEMSPPATLISTPYAAPFAWRMYDPSPDAQQFLMIKDSFSRSEASPPTIIVVQNWFEELKRLVPTAAK